MSEGRNTSEDDCWITNWEQQTINELEGEPDYNERLLSETELASKKLWTLFQSAAQCVAIMYKGIVYYTFFLGKSLYIFEIMIYRKIFKFN